MTVQPTHQGDRQSSAVDRHEAMRRAGEHILQGLLTPEGRSELERFRFPGSTNRVYKVPVAGSEDFIIVKLPAEPLSWRRRIKGFIIRNLLYGEHGLDPVDKRGRFEVERYREWQQAGLNVPMLLEGSTPEVRMIEGLPYPTFYTLLRSEDVSDDEKLAALALITRSLSQQHTVAFERRSKGLVHAYPGPWNIMFDRETGTTYWYDLEHPADYPRMTIEALMVRGLRIFINGVLDHLDHRLDEVVATVVRSYEHDQVLRAFADKTVRSPAALAVRLLSMAGLARERFHRQQRLSAALEKAIAAKGAGWSLSATP